LRRDRSRLQPGRLARGERRAQADARRRVQVYADDEHINASRGRIWRCCSSSKTIRAPDKAYLLAAPRTEAFPDARQESAEVSAA